MRVTTGNAQACCLAQQIMSAREAGGIRARSYTESHFARDRLLWVWADIVEEAMSAERERHALTTEGISIVKRPSQHSGYVASPTTGQRAMRRKTSDERCSPEACEWLANSRAHMRQDASKEVEALRVNETHTIVEILGVCSVARQPRCPPQLTHLPKVGRGSEKAVDLKIIITISGRDIIQCWGPAKTKAGEIPDAPSQGASRKPTARQGHQDFRCY